MDPLTRHAADFIPLDALLTERSPSPYRPTYQFDGPYINESHRFYADVPVDGVKIRTGVPGSLRREDALKLYELAYFARGNVLEVGTGEGLSTSIIARAMDDAGRDGRIYSGDLSPHMADSARRHTDGLPGADRAKFHVAEGAEFVEAMAAAERRFGFVFVDHAHTYEPVKAVAERLSAVTWKGAFCLFHDYKDWRNADPNEAGYQVYQGVEEGMDRRRFQFYGMYGCTALYRRTKVQLSPRPVRRRP